MPRKSMKTKAQIVQETNFHEVYTILQDTIDALKGDAQATKAKQLESAVKTLKEWEEK